MVNMTSASPFSIDFFPIPAHGVSAMFRHDTPRGRGWVRPTAQEAQISRRRPTHEHNTAFGWATPQDLDDIVALTLRVNDFLFGLFLGCGIKLIDLKIEFGRLYEDDMVRIVLADEISPDSCRLWDLRTNEKMDKDRFRRDLGKVEEAYQEVARRLGILIDQGPGDVRGPTTLQ